MRRTFLALVVLLVPGCAPTHTPGGGGVSVSGPRTLTHGVCAVITIDYVVDADGGSVPAVAPSDQSYQVTAVNGSVFSDAACTMPLAGTATLHAGSTSVDVGFVPGTAGMSSGIMVQSGLLTAGYEVVAN